MSATTIGITEQFAFAIIFLFLNLDNSFGFTSGTIRGISGSFLKYLELSITIVFFAAIGAHFSATALPAAKKAIFDFEKSNFYQPSNFRTQEINSIGFVAIGKDFKPILDIIEVELF